MVGSRNSRRFLPLMFVALTAVGLGACSADQASGKVGEPIRAGDYELTVTNLDAHASGPDRFTNPKPGNVLVKADFVMNNKGGLHLPVWASYFTLHDSGGSDNPVRTDVSGDQYLTKQRDVPPGGTTQGTVYFEMAANERPQSIVFAPALVGWRTRIAVQPQG
ncbi:MAG TPA: DUF4352 domain-containing protein [Chloroflexota bacterium]